MKQGCLIVAAVIVLLIAGGVWWISSNVSGFTKEMMAIQEKLNDAGKDLNDKFVFNVPDDPCLSTAQLERYLVVREELNAAVENSRFYLNMKRWQELEEEQGKPSLTDFTGLFKSMLPSLDGIVTAFIDSLERNELSPKEYHYISSILISVMCIELDKRNFHEVIDESFSQDLREMMLDAEKNNAPLHDVKMEILDMPTSGYDKLLGVIQPHLSRINEVSESFYFDIFISSFASDNVPASAAAQADPCATNTD